MSQATGSLRHGDSSLALPSASAARPAQALQAWPEGGKSEDLRRRLLRWAILAPIPPNRPPWLVDLKTDHQLTLS